MYRNPYTHCPRIKVVLVCMCCEKNCTVGVMIRIRNVLMYESHISQGDIVLLGTTSVSPTVSGINQWLMNNCSHEWVDDWIDIDVEMTQTITYCAMCEINK